MTENDKNLWFIWKRRAIHIFAGFFLLFALADITVLQEYCGNESLGIPSYALQSRSEKQKSETKNNIETAFNRLDSSPQEQMPNIPNSEDCFCCCSHTLLGINLILSYSPILVVKKSDTNFTFGHLLSSSHLQLVYQPPKLA